MKKIEIEAQVTSSDYLALMYAVFYKTFFVKIINFLALLLLLPSVFYYFDVFVESPSFISLGIALFILFLVPIFLYFVFQEKIEAAKEVTEVMKFTFSQKEMKIVGKTFKKRFPWEEIYQVEELRYWVLIYPNPEMSFLIKKIYFSDKELKQFKELINSFPDLKKELKP